MINRNAPHNKYPADAKCGNCGERWGSHFGTACPTGSTDFVIVSAVKEQEKQRDIARKAYVNSVPINWHQALNAIIHMAQYGEISRFSPEDARTLRKVADVIDNRLAEHTQNT